MIVYIENFFIAYCGKIRYLFSQHLFAPPPVLLLLSPAPASASSSRLSRPDIFSAPLAHRHLLRAFLAISAPRRGFSYYLPFLLQKKSGFCGFNT